MVVYLSEAKQDKIWKYYKVPKKKSYVKMRKISQLIGQLITSLQELMYGSLYYRDLEANKQIGLATNKGNYEGYIKLLSKLVDLSTSLYVEINTTSHTFLYFI